MWQAIDSTGEGQAPKRNNSPWLGIYFVAFVMFGSFLALNLFVGMPPVCALTCCPVCVLRNPVLCLCPDKE